MKIFVSYSRRDAGDFAEQIRRHFSGFRYDVFTDVDSIDVGDVWSNTISENISNCDIFVIIITHASIISSEVEKEVLQAPRENKIIIPCVHSTISYDEIKWGLEKIQGIEFNNQYDLARNLYSRIVKIQKKNIQNPSNVVKSKSNLPKDMSETSVQGVSEEHIKTTLRKKEKIKIQKSLYFYSK